jgi:hypothetical protein
MGYLMMPRIILFWIVPAYMYRWGYSKAFIDILYSDDVVTQYNTKKNEEQKEGDRVKKTMERWYAMHPEKRPKKKVDLNELIG